MTKRNKTYRYQANKNPSDVDRRDFLVQSIAMTEIEYTSRVIGSDLQGALEDCLAFLATHLSLSEAQELVEHEVGHALPDPDIAAGHFSFVIESGKFRRAAYYPGRGYLANYPCEIVLAMIKGAGDDMSGTDAIDGLRVLRRRDTCQKDGSCSVQSECHYIPHTR